MRIDLEELNEGLEKRKVGHFGFTAITLDPENLGASEYTLATLLSDCSGSVAAFVKEMEAAIQEIVQSCGSSERVDNLMLRLVGFDTQSYEIHGYKLLNQCSSSDYNGILKPGGLTALYDATIDGLEACYHFAEELDDQEDILSNGIIFIITDGYDNSSTLTPIRCKQALQQAVTSEKLESLVSILISVNHEGQTSFAIIDEAKNRHEIQDFQGESVNGQIYSSYNDASQECKQNHSGCIVVPVYDATDQLSAFDREVEFTAFLPLQDAGAKTLAKLAEFVSKSISSQSQSLGTGKPSESVTF